MKKITFILCFLFTSLGFAQITLEDFEGSAPTLGFTGSTSGSATIQTDPAPGAPNGNVLRIITTMAGDPWQQGELTFQNDNLDLSTADKTVSVDWYSIAPFSALIRADSRVGGGSATAAQAEHPGGGWQTLIFDFNNPQDGLIDPPGIYQRLFFFNNWSIPVGGGNGTWPCGVNNCSAKTTYVDNIIGPGTAPPLGVTNWQGTNTDWFDVANWDNGLPSATVPANIPNVANDPTASGPVIVSSLTIESGASFIANAAVTGPVTYERDLSTSNWYYISSPVAGQNVDAFVTGLALETQATFRSFCTFDTAINNWICYENASTFVGDFITGKGYIVNLSAASGRLSFTGTMNVADVSIPLDITASGYNLLGNPYTSFVNTASMLTASSASIATETIYVFDAANNNYVVYVTADDFRLAPGQAFFIQSNGVPGNVAINEAFLSHEDPDTFSRTTNRTEVYLTLSNGSSIKNCRLYYTEGTTTGFDNGYDGPMFRAFADPFSIYTHLVTGGNGTDMGVQSLPNNDHENLVVPIGVTVAAGTEFTISASSINFPDGLDLYLEDRDANTFTLLNANSDFTLTPTNGLNGVGRFYLHTSSSTLGLNENDLASDLHIYTTATTSELIIKGQLSGATNAKLYTIEGKLLLSKALDQFSDSNVLDISTLSSGVYVVNVTNANQTKTQKVIIK